MTGEAGLIQTYFAPLSGVGAFQLGDDCALIDVPEGFELVVTVDTVTEGVDFFEDADADEVAAKALRVNLSDLCAKGARPLGYVLALSMAEADDNWLKLFSDQLAADQKAYGIYLLGGDTTRARFLSVTITAFGLVPKGGMIKRNGARAGDVIAVTGTIGDAALGLQCLLKKAPPHEELIARYRFPQPPVIFAEALRKNASAAMDISDGLVGDLQKLCAASGIGADIPIENIPHSSAATTLITQDENWRDVALTGGDDYQVLFTVPPEKWDALYAEAQRLGVSIANIGHAVAGETVSFNYHDAPRVFTRGAYWHF